jgi:hypothetical protein
MNQIVNVGKAEALESGHAPDAAGAVTSSPLQRSPDFALGYPQAGSESFRGGEFSPWTEIFWKIDRGAEQNDRLWYPFGHPVQ